MLPHSVKMLRHRVQILAHCRPDPRSFRPDPRSLRADGRSLRENARARPRRTPNWPSPRHAVGINGHSSEIEEATPGLKERTLPLERASSESNGRLCDLFLPLFNKSEGPAF